MSLYLVFKSIYLRYPQQITDPSGFVTGSMKKSNMLRRLPCCGLVISSFMTYVTVAGLIHSLAWIPGIKNSSCEKNGDKKRPNCPCLCLTSFNEYGWLGPALSLPSIPVTKLAWKINLSCVRSRENCAARDDPSYVTWVTRYSYNSHIQLRFCALHLKIIHACRIVEQEFCIDSEINPYKGCSFHLVFKFPQDKKNV